VLLRLFRGLRAHSSGELIVSDEPSSPQSEFGGMRLLKWILESWICLKTTFRKWEKSSSGGRNQHSGEFSDDWDTSRGFRSAVNCLDFRLQRFVLAFGRSFRGLSWYEGLNASYWIQSSIDLELWGLSQGGVLS